MSDPTMMAQCAILASTNERVNLINAQILQRIDSPEKTYLSVDRQTNEDPLNFVYDADAQPENLHQINTGNLYELFL